MFARFDKMAITLQNIQETKRYGRTDGQRENSIRAYPGPEFVVANTLAKWKKLQPNKFDFSQGFSQKVVSRSCSVFN